MKMLKIVATDHVSGVCVGGGSFIMKSKTHINVQQRGVYSELAAGLKVLL